MHKIKITTLMSIAIIYLAGCSSFLPAKPLPERSPLAFETAAQREIIETVLLEVIREEFNNEPFRASTRNEYGSRVASLNQNTISFTGTNARFAYRLFLSDNTLEVQNLSKQLHGNGVGINAYCLLCSDHGFTPYVENFISRVELNFINRLSIYDENTNRYQQEIHEKVPAIKNQLLHSMEITSNNKAIPSEVLEAINKPIVDFRYDRNLSVEYSRELAERFPITINARFERCSRSKCFNFPYVVSVINDRFSGHYQDAPSLIKGTVGIVEYNLMPRVVTFKDTTITAVIEGSRITFHNTSSSFVEINHLSLYLDSDIHNNSMEIKLSPNSKHTYSLNSRAISFLSKMTKIIRKEHIITSNFGIAIKYNKNGDERSLFETRTYSHQA